MSAPDCYHDSISHWLSDRPGLDTTVSKSKGDTALHFACWFIVVRLAALSSQLTLNQRTKYGNTALDEAVESCNTSAALYLSWLGAACMPKNKRADPVTVQSWIQAGLTSCGRWLPRTPRY